MHRAPHELAWHLDDLVQSSINLASDSNGNASVVIYKVLAIGGEFSLEIVRERREELFERAHDDWNRLG
jgi:hypothetical protein